MSYFEIWSGYQPFMVIAPNVESAIEIITKTGRDVTAAGEFNHNPTPQIVSFYIEPR